MSNSEPYQLLDFGGGRKLERFGSKIIDRPCAAAKRTTPRQSRDEWRQADWKFVQPATSNGGKWIGHEGAETDAAWVIEFEFARFQLQLTPAGHLGIFPEQAKNWEWIRQHASKFAGQPALNLFAYTGGTTLAAASVGAQVTHVDAARNIVQRARVNAELSAMNQASIRWIVDDVQKYVTREIRRGRRYRAIFLDPPTFGHGVKGRVWKIEKHLPRLLEALAEISDDPHTLLLTCHSPDFDRHRLSEMVENCFRIPHSVHRSGELNLIDPHHRALPSGQFVLQSS